VDFEQLEQLAEEVPAKGFSTPLMPNTESFFSTFPEPHEGQLTAREPMTSFSNSSPHEGHLYSKMGIKNYNICRMPFESGAPAALALTCTARGHYY
jgi:hypothetical protein